jgi:hypothetical protein
LLQKSVNHPRISILDLASHSPSWTCCRALHTFQSAVIQSKLSSVQWAEHSLEAEWQELIHQAWAERQGAPFGVKVRQPADVKHLLETARFIARAQVELSFNRLTTG